MEEGERREEGGEARTETREERVSEESDSGERERREESE